MSRAPISPEKVVEMQFQQLRRLTRNLLVDNPNLQVSQDHRGEDQAPHYMRQYPKTVDYVLNVQREHADYIDERLVEAMAVCRDMAADPEHHHRTLDDRRRSVAETMFENHDFGYPVEASNGWASDGNGEMSRTAFLDVGQRDSIAVTYGISFREGSTLVAENEIYWPKGFDPDRAVDDAPSPG